MFFRKRKAVQEVPLRKLLVPSDKEIELRKLLDRSNGFPKNQNNEAYYLLWKFISDIFTGVNLMEGAWAINSKHALQTIVEERPTENEGSAHE